MEHGRENTLPFFCPASSAVGLQFPRQGNRDIRIPVIPLRILAQLRNADLLLLYIQLATDHQDILDVPQGF